MQIVAAVLCCIIDRRQFPEALSGERDDHLSRGDE
jgi:hypothetical protein